MPGLCQQTENKMTQKKLWEEEIPNWLEILDRLKEVNKIDADNYFISDIENDYKELSLEDEAKKFSLYWSGKRKLKTNRKGSWKLGWRNWLNKALKQEENYGRFKEKSKKNTKSAEYPSAEELEEERRKRAYRKKRRYEN